MPGRRGPSNGLDWQPGDLAIWQLGTARLPDCQIAGLPWFLKMTPEEILSQVKAKFGDAVTGGEVKGVEVRLTVTPEKSWEVCRLLRDTGFDYCNCVSGADWMTHLEGGVGRAAC